jgi:hypothetical protein
MTCRAAREARYLEISRPARPRSPTDTRVSIDTFSQWICLGVAVLIVLLTVNFQEPTCHS